MSYKTDQEAFWAGEFGTRYITRNASSGLLAANLSFFSRALRRTAALRSCLEFGANIGMNLRALKLLYPDMTQAAVEINAEAAKNLGEFIGERQVFCGSMLDFQVTERFDLVLIKGVLIHLNPEVLPVAYRKLHEAAGRWILICEYYNPTPIAVTYRGHADRLFKRDFAGEMLETFPDLHLVDYGFVYRRDPVFPQDDITWFLLEKKD